MERVDTIMERLGFNKDAEDGVKAAFVKNLIKQAYGVDVPLPSQYEIKAQRPQTLPQAFDDLPEQFLKNIRQELPSAGKASSAQLSFDLEYTPPKVG